MIFARVILLPGLCVGLCAAHAADATTPIDYTQRNAPFATGGTVSPDKKTPEVNEAVQDKRVEKTTVEKKPAAVGEKRAAIDIKEARDKNVREKDSHRPEVVEQSLSKFNHREAAVSTGADSKRPELLAKYQDSLAAASASNMARFPALDRATTAKINRFVFRKNPAESEGILGGAAVVPAAGAPTDVSEKSGRAPSSK